MEMTVHKRIDWASERDRVDLAALVTRLLGPAPGRRGGGRRLYWICPFHADRNPSFEVDPKRPHWWRCRGCGASGDAIDLVRKLNPQMSFPEAAAFILGEAPPPQSTGRPKAPSVKPSAPAPAKPKGMLESEALALIGAAERRLWTPEGLSDLAYLRQNRGLTDATIRTARLGSTPPLDLPGKPRGVVLAWWQGDRPALVKIRQLRGRSPKYHEVFRCSPGAFLGNGPILAGLPLVITEGEFDCLLLAQELAGLVSVCTLGSASGRPDATNLGPMLAAFPWLVATDADAAGDESAAWWPSHARRVRPPLGKDWTEAKQSGVDLRRWWADVLAGADQPPPFTWAELSTWRWGPAIGDPTPGLDVGEPFTSQPCAPWSWA